jgi:hypothetical protein
MAKQNTIERQSTTEREVILDGTSESVKPPIHDLTVRLTNSLQHMHHQLQGFLMQKLGPEARNIIVAERVPEPRLMTGGFEGDQLKPEGGVIAKRLSEVGQDVTEELYQLNLYRKLYAMMLAELEVARDNMVELEHRIEEESIGSRRSAEMIIRGPNAKARRRRSKNSSSGDLSDE